MTAGEAAADETIVREYRGATPDEAAAAYTQEATDLVARGFGVAAQAWTPERTLVVTYQRSLPSPPPLVVAAAPATAHWAPPPAAAPRLDRWCTRCGRYQSPAWAARCEHCGARYAEFPPAPTPPPPGIVLAAPGRSRGATVAIILVVIAAILIVLVFLTSVALLANLPQDLPGI
ncbi:MAG: hypothetical protein ACXVAE_07775 [Candidatus Limnocylindrales bacterium]